MATATASQPRLKSRYNNTIKAQLAKDLGIRIYTIGVGAGPMTVRTAFGNQIVDPAQDLDEATLQQIADLTGGQYFRATDVAGLSRIYKQIDKLEPVEDDPETVRPTIALYYLPLGLALFLTMVLALMIALPRLSRPILNPEPAGA